MARARRVFRLFIAADAFYSTNESCHGHNPARSGAGRRFAAFDGMGEKARRSDHPGSHGPPGSRISWSDKRPVDPLDQQKILAGYAARGILSINECRDQLGLDPVEGGDIATIDVAGQGPVPVSALGRSPESGSGSNSQNRLNEENREVGKVASRPFAQPATSPARLRAAAALHREIGKFFKDEPARLAGEGVSVPTARQGRRHR